MIKLPDGSYKHSPDCDCIGCRGKNLSGIQIVGTKKAEEMSLLDVIRRCKKCGVEKPIYAFVKAKRSALGREWKCKACAAKYQRDLFRNRPYPSKKEYQRKLRREKNPILRAKDKRNARIQRLRYPEHIKARSLLAKAVQSKVIAKLSTCSTCGASGRIEGHHHKGYSYPLEVIWLCVACHRLVHRSLKDKP